MAPILYGTYDRGVLHNGFKTEQCKHSVEVKFSLGVGGSFPFVCFCHTGV